MILMTYASLANLILGDVYYYGDGGCCGGCLGPFIGCGICGVFWIALYGVFVFGTWKMFVKAGEPGWASIVPIYNIMILAKMGGREPTEGLMVLIPIYGIYVAYLIYVDVARAFGKEQGFAILMLLVPFVAFPMLGFGDAQFRGAGGKRRARRDVDED